MNMEDKGWYTRLIYRCDGGEAVAEIDLKGCILLHFETNPKGKGIGSAAWPLVEKQFKKPCDEIWLIPADYGERWEPEDGPKPSEFFTRRGFRHEPWRAEFPESAMFKPLAAQATAVGAEAAMFKRLHAQRET